MKHHPDCHPSSACYNDHGAYSDMCQDFEAYRCGYEAGKAAGDAAGYARCKAEIVAYIELTVSDRHVNRRLSEAIERGEHAKADGKPGAPDA